MNKAIQKGFHGRKNEENKKIQNDSVKKLVIYHHYKIRFQKIIYFIILALFI